jgi:hypothetical protein
MVAKLGSVLTCHRKLTPGMPAGGCHDSATGSVTDVPGAGPTGVGTPGTAGGRDWVGVQPDSFTSTETDPSNKVATQLGSLKPLAEMEKLPWASAWPVGSPSSTVTFEPGTAPDPTMVSCPFTRLAWEVTIAAPAGAATPRTAMSVAAATAMAVNKDRDMMVPHPDSPRRRYKHGAGIRSVQRTAGYFAPPHP